MSEEFMKIVKSRRSVRSFKSEPLPDGTVEKLLEAARWAPSAGNVQPWEFFVVRNQDLKEKLGRAALGQMFLAQAPVVIVVCAVPIRSALRYKRRGEKLYCIQDTAAAAQNILLLATALGLASCWVGAFEEEAVRRVLALDHSLLPVALIPVGRGEKIPSPPPRRPLGEIVHYFD